MTDNSICIVCGRCDDFISYNYICSSCMKGIKEHKIDIHKILSKKIFESLDEPYITLKKLTKILNRSSTFEVFRQEINKELIKREKNDRPKR